MNLNKKSRLVSFILTLLFGPLGLFYSSLAGGLVLVIIAATFWFTLFVPITCWILAIAIGDHCTYKHNKSLENFATLVARDK